MGVVASQKAWIVSAILLPTTISPNIVNTISSFAALFTPDPLLARRLDVIGSALEQPGSRTVCEGVGNRVNIASRSLRYGGACCVL